MTVTPYESHDYNQSGPVLAKLPGNGDLGHSPKHFGTDEISHRDRNLAHSELLTKRPTEANHQNDQRVRDRKWSGIVKQYSERQMQKRDQYYQSEFARSSDLRAATSVDITEHSCFDLLCSDHALFVCSNL